MTEISSKIKAIASNPWAVIIANIASTVSFLWLVYDKTIAKSPSLTSVVISFTAVIFFMAVSLYSARIRSQNIAYQMSLRRFHKINHYYRDTLCSLFFGDDPETDIDKLVPFEAQTMKAVCQQIKEIFDDIIGKPCMVTVKLIAQDSSGKFCSTYVRSEDICERDNEEPTKYELGRWVNTAFDTALQNRTAGECACFFSGDLIKERNYNNQRQHWDRYYRSAIVVPIRARRTGSDGRPEFPDDIGFLCVDTLSQNRLNKKYYVHLLAAFADQMYNFMSLMRGKYNVLVHRGNGNA